MSLKKNIIRVFSANIINLISSIVIGFIVPAILSIETYSNFKLYSFYISYIGLLHFGFVDGIYIKYGGKNINEINKGELKGEHNILLLSQIILTCILLIFSFVNKNIILFLLALSIIPVNMLSFYNLLYQSIGEFKKYSINMYIYTFLYLALNILLAVIFRSDNYIHYCIITILANLLVIIILEIQFYDRSVKAIYTKKFINNIKVGFFVLLGNLSVALFYAIDRWFIKIFFSINDFGYYSFALSLLNIINILVSSISTTLFNHISKNEDFNEIILMKRYLLLLGGIASLAYFPLAGIIFIFIPKYIPSLSIIAISFSAYPYMIIINAIYINLYKAEKKQKHYAKIVATMVIVSIIYNIISINIYKNIISIAFATTISFITWYYYSMKDFKYLKTNAKEILYLIIIFLSFILSSNMFSWYLGGMIYLIIYVTLSAKLYKKEIYEILKYIKNIIVFKSVI